MITSRNSRHAVPQLNTASLPDLIFTVLFFFMVVTHMRKVTLKVRYRVPQGTELTRLTKKSAVSYIYIGQPTSATANNTAATTYGGKCIQINDRIATTDEITDFMIGERHRMSAEDRQQQMVSVKADRNTPMGFITDVKQALRKANVRKISYSAEQK